jgi:hypothetical protein
MRQTFVDTATALLDEDPRTAVVLADISAEAFAPAARAHPDRVVNVGIREQLMLGVAGGLALTGLRPIVHSYAPFVVDRAYEQIKLDLNHQGVGAVLVSIGASYDASAEGRTHQSPGDVALFDTLGGWKVHVPGHADEVGPLLTAAAAHDEPVYIRLSTQRNAQARPATGLQTIRAGGRAAVVAVGPMLDTVPGRHVERRGLGRAPRRATPTVEPGRRVHRPAPLRQPEGPRTVARAGPGRRAAVDQRFRGLVRRARSRPRMNSASTPSFQVIFLPSSRPRAR